jgi:hypothetical protein
MRQDRADFSADFDIHILVSHKQVFTFPTPHYPSIRAATPGNSFSPHQRVNNAVTH